MTSNIANESAGADTASLWMSRGLGLVGLTLGAAELAAPRAVARLIGVEPDARSRVVLRAMGAREVLSGIGVTLAPRRPLPLWIRLVGDAIDLAALGIAARGASRRQRIAAAAIAVAGVGALDAFAALRAQRAYDAANRPVIASVTINAPPDAVYAYFRQLGQLPVFMDYLESVVELDRTRSRWTAKLPVKGTVEWEAEIIEDIPGQVIEWRSVEGSKIKTSGRVMFTPAPASTMTEVRVEMSLGFTGVGASVALAKLFAKPQVKGDLRRFKQIIETGEVLVSDASAHRLPHPAQPSETIDSKHAMASSLDEVLPEEVYP